MGAWTSRGRGRQGGATEKADGMIIRPLRLNASHRNRRRTRFQWRSRRSEMQFRNYLSLAYALRKLSNERIRGGGRIGGGMERFRQNSGKQRLKTQTGGINEKLHQVKG